MITSGVIETIHLGDYDQMTVRGGDTNDILHAGKFLYATTFDEAYYAEQNPAIAASGQDLYTHYLNVGEAQGLRPNRYFDPKAYFDIHQDVKNSRHYTSPLEHFRLAGAYEKRVINHQGTGYDEFTSVDEVHGGGGNDIIYGNFKDDSLQGNTGNDTIYGHDGNDSIRGGQDQDYLQGDAGNDVMFGDLGNDTLQGNDGKDTLYGGDGNDSIRGGKDDDSLQGNIGRDSIFGDLGNDSIRGGQGNDVLEGNDGNDTLHGDLGKDMVTGGDGDDLIYGGLSTDTLQGNTGRDTLYGGFGNDSIEGGKEDDFLSGGDDHDTLHGDLGNDLVMGGEGNDILHGGQGADTLEGDAGNDLLHGDEGSDTFLGGDGDDTLTSGHDQLNESGDVLTGGAGKDLFHLAGFGKKRITDYSAEDTIRLELPIADLSQLSFQNGTLRFANLLEVQIDGYNGDLAGLNIELNSTGILDIVQDDTDVMVDVMPQMISGEPYYLAYIPLSDLVSNDLIGRVEDIHVNPLDKGAPIVIQKEVNGVMQPVIEFEFSKDGPTSSFDYWIDFGGYRDHGTVDAIRNVVSELSDESMRDMSIKGNMLTFNLGLPDVSKISFQKNANLKEASSQVTLEDAGRTLRYGQSGHDEFAASSQSDVVLGGQGNDVLRAGSAEHVLLGGSGNDTLHSGQGDAVLSGGSGQDQFVIAAAADNVVYVNDLSAGDMVDLSAFSHLSGIDDLVIRSDRQYNSGRADYLSITNSAGISSAGMRFKRNIWHEAYIDLGNGQKLKFLNGGQNLSDLLKAEHFTFASSSSPSHGTLAGRSFFEGFYGTVGADFMYRPMEFNTHYYQDLTWNASLMSGASLPDWLTFDGTYFSGRSNEAFHSSIWLQGTDSQGQIIGNVGMELRIGGDGPEADVRLRADEAFSVVPDVMRHPFYQNLSWQQADDRLDWLSVENQRIEGHTPSSFEGSERVWFEGRNEAGEVMRTLAVDFEVFSEKNVANMSDQLVQAMASFGADDKISVVTKPGTEESMVEYLAVDMR